MKTVAMNGATAPGRVRDRRALVEAARDMLAARRRLHGAIGRDYVMDCAWELLLGLFVARGSDLDLSVAEAASQTTAPATVALRWFKVLAQDGFAEQQPGPRGTVVRLTDAGWAHVAHAIEAVAGPIPPV